MAGTGKSAKEIVGALTKAEVMSILPVGRLSAHVYRTWKSLHAAIEELPFDLKDKIFVRAMQKGTKRKRELAEEHTEMSTTGDLCSSCSERGRSYICF